MQLQLRLQRLPRPKIYLTILEISLNISSSIFGRTNSLMLSKTLEIGSLAISSISGKMISLTGGKTTSLTSGPKTLSIL